ncbi:uncharacterized protein LOC112462160 [Temnothorax curvispinosus]|uniref:Uncharacterized protein LOC112462160 n=1 Tax=Temnothorax curvispinosus TaxID=300111 RepID=A0A6J1QNP2_9HYME|nr:uncharacterized protein LOC112462160 [Temnothorax curvispinosus]
MPLEEVIQISMHLEETHKAFLKEHVLANILPSFNVAPLKWPHLTKLTLADPDFLTPRPVDIIIGAVSYGQIIKPNIIKRDTLMPIAQLSIFGWLVLGPVDISSPASAAVHHASIQEREDALDELLSKFWTQEEVPASTNHDLTPDEKRWRYTVRIPLKLSPNTLSDSYLTAHRCLQSLLRRLSRDDNYRRLYHQFMTEYQELNHMKKALPASSQHTQYYLSHHGVLKPDSATTKLRVVFNGSSASTSGRSLNDLMHTGAKLHLDITDGLLWIRQVRHLVATDITKMYRQINVHENDWDIQRILWIDDQLNEVPHYLTTVTYETNAAPFLSVQTLLWLPQEDTFTFSTRISSHTDHLTKRLVLSEVAQIFDPLGFASPGVIKAKMLLQEFWLHKAPMG